MVAGWELEGGFAGRSWLVLAVGIGDTLLRRSSTRVMLVWSPEAAERSSSKA